MVRNGRKRRKVLEIRKEEKDLRRKKTLRKVVGRKGGLSTNAKFTGALRKKKKGGPLRRGKERAQKETCRQKRQKRHNPRRPLLMRAGTASGEEEGVPQAKKNT